MNTSRIQYVSFKDKCPFRDTVGDCRLVHIQAVKLRINGKADLKISSRFNKQLSLHIWKSAGVEINVKLKRSWKVKLVYPLYSGSPGTVILYKWQYKYCAKIILCVKYMQNSNKDGDMSFSEMLVSITASQPRKTLLFTLYSVTINQNRIWNTLYTHFNRNSI